MWVKVIIGILLFILVFALTAYSGLLGPLGGAIGLSNDNFVSMLPTEVKVCMVIVAVAICAQIAYSFYE